MRAIFFAPHGFAGQELGSAMVSAKMLDSGFEQSVFLQCDGAHAVCGRDESSRFCRSLGHCLKCMSEQDQVNDWLGWEVDNLSRFLSHEQQKLSARIVARMSSDELESFDYLGVPVAELVRPFVHKIQRANKLDAKYREGIYRQVLKSAIRFLFQVENCFSEHEPDLVFLTGKEDYMSQVVTGVCQKLGVRLLRFFWVPGERNVSVLHPERGVAIPSDIFLEHINHIPSRPSEWNEELVEMVARLLSELNLAPGGTLSTDIVQEIANRS